MTTTTRHTAENDATWRDYCKHYGSCEIPGENKCFTPDDPAYIAEMERRYPRVIPPASTDPSDPA